MALFLAAHAAWIWARADTGLWVWSVAGFLGLLAALGVVGLARPDLETLVAIRGALAVATSILVGEATGALVGVFWVWFLLLSVLYPVVLPRWMGIGATFLIAAGYAGSLHRGAVGMPVQDALTRGAVLAVVGLVSVAIGALIAYLIGERDAAETRLLEVQGVLEAAFETASAGMVLLDLDGRIADANQALADFLGRDRDSLLGVGWGSLLRAEDARRMAARVADLVSGEIWSFRFEARFQLRDRRARWGLIGMSLVSDASGRPTHVFADVTNITDRVRAEQRIRESEAHYRSLFDLAPVPLMELDLSSLAALLDVWHAQGATDVDEHLAADPREFDAAVNSIEFLSLNETARRLLGAADAAELAAAASGGLLGAGYLDLIRVLLRGLWEQARTIEAGVELRSLDGDRREGLARLAVPIVEGRHDHSRALLSFTDLTESLEARSELEALEQRLLSVMSSAPIVLFAVDADGVFTVTQGQGLAALGLDPGEAVGQSAFEMYKDVPDVVGHLRRALDGEAFTGVVGVGDRTFETRYSPVGHDGSVNGVIGVAYDVTERTRATEQLQRLVRAKDEFVAAVSHELRTPLTAVVGFSHELRTRFDDLSPDEIETFIAMVDDQAAEVGDLIEDLLVASRTEIAEVTVSREAFDIWEPIDAVLRVHRLGPRLAVEHDGSEAKVLADPVRVRQVFRNLLTNADRYGGDHVTVRVISGPETTSLYVIDDGDGVPEDDRERIFEPYFRAHRSVGLTESVGLGLTVSRQLARLMGGDLVYQYYQGHSFFELRLPTV